MALDEKIQFYCLPREMLRLWAMTPNVQKQHWLKLSLPPAPSCLFLFPSPQPFAALHHEPNWETDPIKKKQTQTKNQTIKQ